MKRTFIPLAGTSGVLVASFLVFASVTGAHETRWSADVEAGTCPCAAKQATLMQHQIERLQQHLPLGQMAASYPDYLRAQGWEITDTREESPTSVEYNIARGDLTAKLRLKLDEETGKATQVTVVNNANLPGETEGDFAHREPRRMHFAEARQPQAWEERQSPSQSADYGSSYSDRDRVRAERMGDMDYSSLAPGFRFSDRARVQIGQMLSELQRLPVGRDKRFYYTALRSGGYDIPAIYIDTPGQLQVEVEKNNQRAVVTVTFANETNDSNAVYASPLPRNESPTRTSSALP